MTPAELKQKNEAAKLRHTAWLALRKETRAARAAALDDKIAELSAAGGE